MEHLPDRSVLGFRWGYWNTPTGRQIAKVLTKDGRQQLQGEREQRRLQRWRQRHPEEWARHRAIQRQRSNEMREEFLRGQEEQAAEGEDEGAKKKKKKTKRKSKHKSKHKSKPKYTKKSKKRSKKKSKKRSKKRF